LIKDDSDLDFPQPDQDDDYNNTHPFEDDSRGPRASLALALSNDEAEVMGGIDRIAGAGGGEDSLDKTDSRLRLDDDDTDDDLNKKKNAVGGLDTDEEEEEELKVGPAELADETEAGTSKNKGGRRPVDPTKRRRARRIVMDVGATRLTSDEIRQNLADASDLEIVQIHPATWISGRDPSQQPSVLRSKSIEERIREVMPRDVYLARPSCADDGTMSPDLLHFWMRHTAPILGKEFPYELLTKEEPTSQGSGKKDGKEDMDEAEVARKGHGEEDEEMTELKLKDDDEPEFPQPDDEPEFPPPDSDGAVHPFEDEDDVQPPSRDEEMEEPGDENIPSTYPKVCCASF
jgi:hypothetical protein